MSETVITLAELEDWAARCYCGPARLHALTTEELQWRYTTILVARMLAFSHAPASGQARAADVEVLTSRLEECLVATYAVAAERGLDRRMLMAGARTQLAAVAEPVIDPSVFIRRPPD